jgi:hypothetical protein
MVKKNPAIFGTNVTETFIGNIEMNRGVLPVC